MSTALHPLWLNCYVPIAHDKLAGQPRIPKLTIYWLHSMKINILSVDFQVDPPTSQPICWMTNGNKNNAVEGKCSFIAHIIPYHFIST